MHFERSSGLLLHITSLPGRFGCGDLGPEAYHFIDFLHSAGQAFWQVFPLGPVGKNGNPYGSLSSFAGSKTGISLEILRDVGDLTTEEIESASRPDLPVIEHLEGTKIRSRLLSIAAERFFARHSSADHEAFKAFAAQEATWLDDWAVFAALRQRYGSPWWSWPKQIARHTPAALEKFIISAEREIRLEKYCQFRFFLQWKRLREYANHRGIRIIGDIPFYCGRDSCDIWSSPHLFMLDGNLMPEQVGGVPPDAMYPQGQVWQAPVYRWDSIANCNYQWWVDRINGTLRHVNALRLDHFLAFESYWAIPFGKQSKDGRWMKGPGDALFEASKRAFGDLPFIAEDLGPVSTEAMVLRERWGFYSMRVLQYAFSEIGTSRHLPIYYTRSSVVYTGTQDTNTSVGWYSSVSERERDIYRRYTGTDGHDCHHFMIRLAYGSVADLAIVPVQDVLGIGSEARMNIPSKKEGCWRWRLLPKQLGSREAELLYSLSKLFGRLTKRPLC